MTNSIILIFLVALIFHFSNCNKKKTSENLTESSTRFNFFFSDTTDFEKMPAPKAGDWLYHHKEEGQTFDDYIKTDIVRKTENRNKIVIQLLGEFSDSERELITKVSEFCGIWFDTVVEIKEATKLENVKSRKRIYGYGSFSQYLTDDILYKILKPKKPKDAVCYIGVTMSDLYPDESWNYVFGQASLVDGIGVFSLIRYFPRFWGEEENEDSKVMVLRRSCKVLAHEMGHMFSIKHCIFYKCNMNGSNSLEESDSRPLRLCPVCLKKLHYNIGFDVVERYKKLKKFYEENNLKEESEWIEKRLKKYEDSIK